MNRSDNFNRSEDPITTPSDGGSNWLNATMFGCNGSIMYANAGGEPNLECSVTDHSAIVKIVTAGSQTGITCRYAGGSGYLWFRGSTGNMTLYTLPGFSVLAATGNSVNGNTIGISAVGTTIKGYINGVEIVSVTNGTYTTGTKCGLYSGNTYDDFAITDLSGGGGGGSSIAAIAMHLSRMRK